MTNKNTVLTLNGKTIHSLQELRDNFKAEELMKQYLDETLIAWLNEHYYETEASIIDKVIFDRSFNIQKLCEVLKIDYDPYANMTEEEKAIYDEKKRIVSEFTSDSSILSNLHLVAMNQEELAGLLNHGNKKIYLCKEHFSVPIRESGKEYICISNAVIDNAYTEQQYKRAGITVIGFDLPEHENPDTIELAKDAAASYGYDDYHETHSFLASIFHNKLKSERLINWHHVPYDSHVDGKFYKSKSECEQARDEAIRRAYGEAEKYFSTGDSKSLASEAAQRYSEHIASVFDKNRHVLATLCSLTNTSEYYDMLCDKVNKCHKNLLTKFENELNYNRDYYSMYNIDYFIEQVDIEEHDYRVEEDFLARVLETLFTDSIEYSITNLYSSISEIEQDLDYYSNTFYGAAYNLYKEYVSEIEDIIEQIGRELPANNEGEEPEDYIKRCCAKEVG